MCVCRCLWRPFRQRDSRNIVRLRIPSEGVCHSTLLNISFVTYHDCRGKKRSKCPTSDELRQTLALMYFLKT